MTHESPASAGTPTASRLVWVLAACALLYSTYRAATLSLSHDEALTYLSHASGTLDEILTFANWIPSNNHLLNTLLIKVSVAAFGDSELAIRLPALVGHALYLFAVARILALFTRGHRLVLGYALLVLNPYLLDFFSVARGYGLALGFLGIGMHGFFQRIIHPVPRLARRGGQVACFAFLLASLANLGFGIPFLAVLGLTALLDLIELRRIKEFHPLTIVVPLASLALFRLAYDSHNLARIRQQIRNFGGEDGFWADSVGSVVHCSQYSPYWPPLRLTIPAAVFLALVITCALLHLARARRMRRFRSGQRMILGLLALFLVIATGIQLQRMIFELHYPIARGVIYLIPLFHLLLILVWEVGAQLPGLRGTRTLSLIGLVSVLALTLQGARHLNLTHTLRWRYDADTKEAILALREMFPQPASDSDTPKVRLGINSVFEPSTNYYLMRNRMDWFEETQRKQELDGSHDIYFLKDAHWVELAGLTVVREFATSGACIARSTAAIQTMEN